MSRDAWQVSMIVSIYYMPEAGRIRLMAVGRHKNAPVFSDTDTVPWPVRKPGGTIPPLPQGDTVSGNRNVFHHLKTSHIPALARRCPGGKDFSPVPSGMG